MRKILLFACRVAFLLTLGLILALGWFGVRAVGGLFGCPFSIPFVMCHTCPNPCAFRSIRTWLLGSILATGFFSGRVFCGLACPCGTVQDLLHRFPQRVPPGLDKRLRYIKFCSSTLLVGGIIQLLWSGYSPLGKLIYPALLVFSLISLFVSRPWCRYLCPLGALTSPFNKFCIFSTVRNEKKCLGCRDCDESCPAGLRISYMKNASGSLECMRCFGCISSCRSGALRLRMGFSRRRI